MPQIRIKSIRIVLEDETGADAGAVYIGEDTSWGWRVIGVDSLYPRYLRIMERLSEVLAAEKR